MAGDRPIDRIRDAAGSFNISHPDENTSIEGFIKIGGILHVYTQKALYATKLADDVDPERINIHIPNSVQRVAFSGAADSGFGQILLTAHGLFNRKYLVESIDCDKAMIIALDFFKESAAILESATSFAFEEEAAFKKLEDYRQKNGAVILPAIGNAKMRLKNFLQQSDHARQHILDIVELFYPDAISGWADAIPNKVKSLYGVSDGFTEFAKKLTPFLMQIRAFRNCIEHPKENQRIIIDDFKFSADGEILPPTMSVIDKRYPLPEMPISIFMDKISKEWAPVFELLISYLCERHLQPSGAFNIQLFEVSEADRVKPHVRFQYGGRINGKMFLFSPGD